MKVSDSITAIGLTPTARVLGVSRQAAHKRRAKALTSDQAAEVLEVAARSALGAAERLRAAAASLRRPHDK